MGYSLPAKAVIGVILTKKKIFEKGDVNYKTKEDFSKYIQKITREYKIDTESIGIPKGEQIEGIAIFKIILKGKEIPDKILSIIDKKIPYPILYEIVSGDKIAYAIKYNKEYYKSERNKDIEFDFNGINLDRVYEKIISCFIPLENDEYNFQEQIEWNNKVKQLKDEIEKLEKERDKEVQFNRKVPINLKIQAKKKELNKLLSHKNCK